MTLYLNDIGVLCPLGAGQDEVLAGLLAADDSGMAPYDGLATGRKTLVGRVRAELPAPPPELADLDCRNNRLLAHALDQIADAVATWRETVGGSRVAVVLGTSTSGIGAGEAAIEALARAGRMPSGYHYRQQEIGTAAEFAARYLKLTGLRYTISTACSSSAKAFASAWRLLEAGRCDAAVVG
ncbi:MAG TPA: beta-ketoacyl synthase N-terminal-like domain-containing protein, partial [Gammaproteobacteria bacterium]